MGDIGTHELVGENDILASFFVLGCWLDPADDTTELTSTTSLLLVRVVERCATGDRFTVGDTGLASCALHIVFTAHTFHIDFKMELAHAGNDSL